jgi:hypothetical protein
MHLRKRHAAAAAGVLSALAVAAPIAGGGAATRPTAFPAFAPLPAFSSWPAFHPVPLSFVGPSIGFVGVAIGPTVIGSVFNGATVVQVVNGPAGSSVIGSP